MTVSYTPTIWGYQVGANWFTGPTVQIGGGRIGGLQYLLPATSESLTFRSLTLQLRRSGNNGTGTFSIGLVNNPTEVPYSGTNLPSTKQLVPLYSAAATFTGPASNHTYNLELEVDPLDGTVGGFGPTPMQVLRHSNFAGYLSLVIQFTGNLILFSPTTSMLLSGDEAQFLTGWPTSKRRYSAADWCPRCGQPVFREQLIRDGYTKGLVCSDCWDRDEQRYPPFRPPKEINPR